MTPPRHAAWSEPAPADVAEGRPAGRATVIVVAVVAIALTAIRVWICLQTPVNPSMGKVHDEGLFLRQASSILGGDWLGDDPTKAMVKSPGFALFLAAVGATPLPYQLWIAVALVVAAGLSAQALRPAVPNLVVRLLVYLAFLYSPVALSPHAFVSVYRNLPVSLLAVMAFASFSALWLRRRERLPGGWLAAAAVSLSLFWIMNESSVWILPFAGAATAAIAVSRLRRREWAAAILDAIPLVACAACTLGICWANLAHYGVFATNVRYEGPFAEACGYLLSLEGDGTLEDADGEIRWTDEEAFDAAFQASPTLAADREAIEASLYNWAQGSAYAPIGDLYAWALIDATFANGSVDSLEGFDAYWAQVADELGAAIEDGELATADGLAISRTTPPIGWDAIPDWIRTGLSTALRVMDGDLLQSGLYNVDDVQSELTGGTWEEQMEARSLLGGPTFSWSEDGELTPLSDANWLAFRLDTAATSLWRLAMPALLVAWVAALGLLVVRAILGSAGARGLLLPVAGIFLSVIELSLAVSWFCNFLASWSLFDYLQPALAIFILCELMTYAGAAQELIAIARGR